MFSKEWFKVRTDISLITGLPILLFMGGLGFLANHLSNCYEWFKARELLYVLSIFGSTIIFGNTLVNLRISKILNKGLYDIKACQDYLDIGLVIDVLSFAILDIVLLVNLVRWNLPVILLVITIVLFLFHIALFAVFLIDCNNTYKQKKDNNIKRNLLCLLCYAVPLWGLFAVIK